MSGYISEVYRWANREGYKVSPLAGRVLVELVTYTDLKTGICWPKRETLAKNLWSTENPTKSQLNMVSRAISALVEAGLIEATQTYLGDGRWSSNEYRVILPVPTPSGHGSPLGVGTVQPTQSGHGSPLPVGTKYPVEVSKEKVSTEGTSGGTPRRWNNPDLYAEFGGEAVDSLKEEFEWPPGKEWTVWMDNYQEMGRILLEERSGPRLAVV